MLAAAEADGVVLDGGGYRSTASQVQLRAAHCGTTAYDIWDRPSAECGPATATPGASRHETGEAIDFLRCTTRATACYQWLAANASRYGFYNQPSEAWHWSIDGR
jgi:LAS superfamily LD-carboxypeptidase LdcB